MGVTRSKMLLWTKEVLPYVIMLMVEFLDMSILTIVKAAMNGGMNKFVYIVYHDALGTLILLPFFIIHIFRFVVLLLRLFGTRLLCRTRPKGTTQDDDEEGIFVFFKDERSRKDLFRLCGQINFRSRPTQANHSVTCMFCSVLFC